MNEAIMIAGMALVTFAVRYPILAFLNKIPLPEGFFKALKFVAPTVLAAIIFPAALLPKGELALQPTNAHLYASLFAFLVAWRSKNLLLTILLGMATFWVWQLII